MKSTARRQNSELKHSESPPRDESQSAPTRCGHVHAVPRTSVSREPTRVRPESPRRRDILAPREPGRTGGSTCRSPRAAPDGAGSARHHAHAKETAVTIKSNLRAEETFEKKKKRCALDWSTRVPCARTRRASGNPAGHACTEEARTACFPGTCPVTAAVWLDLERWPGLRIQTNHLDRPPAINNASLIDSVEPSSDVM